MESNDLNSATMVAEDNLDVAPRRRTHPYQLFHCCLPKAPKESPLVSRSTQRSSDIIGTSKTSARLSTTDPIRPVDGTFPWVCLFILLMFLLLFGLTFFHFFHSGFTEEIEFDEGLPALDDSDDDGSDSMGPSPRKQGYARVIIQHQQALLVGFFQMIVSLVFLGKLKGGQQQNKYIEPNATDSQKGDATKEASTYGDDAVTTDLE